jgi:hypothetical protein
MAAAANANAFVQGLQDAANAAAGLVAGGGVPAAQVQAAVQAAVLPLQQSVQALQQTQAQTTQALQALQQSVQALHQAQAQTAVVLQGLQQAVTRSETTAAKAYNGGCRDGAARPFVPVPNAAGLVVPAAPAALAAPRSFADLMALNGQQLGAWCAHYGIAAPQALAQRRINVALALGAVPIVGDRW